MAKGTSIEWTDHTFNPWWGCQKVSPGCAHCYAERWAKRTGHGGTWEVGGERRTFGDRHWDEPLRWDDEASAAGRRDRVFCASMADVFEDRQDLIEPRERLWRLVLATPFLDWLVLTKRPENVMELIPEEWHTFVYSGGEEVDGWPSNVWLGVSVENQATADERIPILLDTPAALRFVSYEPALGPVDLTGWFDWAPGEVDVGATLDWVIAGGESGPGARLAHPDWYRDVRDACQGAGVPFFFKQWGEWGPADAVPGNVRMERLQVSTVERHPRTALEAAAEISDPGDPMATREAGAVMYQIGKKGAGALLDGVEWLEVPTPPAE